jgi:Mycothiol maleylpyruvate isomerase N-terminal domain
MAESPTLDQLIGQAEQAVQKTLGYLEGPGASSTVRIDLWGVREIAAHLLYWHQVTAEAALAVARGEPPRRFTSPVDDINEEVVAQYASTSTAEILAQIKGAHQTLLQAIRDLPDPDAVLMRRADGSSPTVKDRLRTIAHHWDGHLNELMSAPGAPRP